MAEVRKTSIGIEIQTLGTTKVLKDLGQLTAEIRDLQEALLDTQFGTAEFKETADAIKKLRGETANIEKDLEGLDREKQIRALGAGIQALTGSFQVLSGVLGLVVSDSESLEAVQKAEAQALQILNVALGINAVNQAIVEASQLKLNLATKAYTIAVNLASKAQALWNAALAANPIGLVVGAVVALSAAIYGLVKAYDALFGAEAQQEKQLKAINELENSLIKTRKEASKDLEFQLTILTDNVSTRALERKTLEDLKKTYPGLNAFIDKNNKLTKDGIAFLKLQIQLRKDEAALNAVQSKLIEKEIAFQEKAAEIQQEYGASAGILIKELKADYDESIRPITIVQEKYTKALNGTLEALTPYQKRLDAAANSEKKILEIQREQVAETSKRTKLLQGLVKVIAAQDEALKKVLETELEYTADVLELQNKVLQEQEDLINKRTEAFTTAGERLAKEADELFLKIIPSDVILAKTEDRFQELFDSVGRLVASGVIDFNQNISDSVLVETLKTLGKEGEELINIFTGLTDESQQSLLDFFNNVKFRVDSVKKLFDELPTELGIAKPTDLQILQAISDVEDEIFGTLEERLGTGQTIAQIEEEGLKKLTERLGLSKVLENLEKGRDQNAKNLLALDNKILASKNKTIDLQNKLNKTTDEAAKANLEKEIQAQENATKTLELKKQTAEEERDATEASLEALLQFRDTQFEAIKVSLDYYKGVETITKETNKNSQEIKNNLQEINRSFTEEDVKRITDFFKANIDNVDNAVEALLKNLDKFRDKIGQIGVNKVFEGIKKSLKDIGVEGQDSLEATRDYLQDVILINEAVGINVDETKDLLEAVNDELNRIELEEAFDKLDAFTQKISQSFNQVSNQYRNLLQSQNSLLLEGIAADEAAALKAVEGFTEKEELVRKDFAKKRFDVEKASRIQEIKFSIAQLITDTAGAITNTLANVPTPFNIPLAGVIGGLGAAQVLQAQSQLTFVQAQQFVGRRGGMIVGQSHEGSNGGVPALLEGGEFVVNKAAVSQYGDLIGELNSATGGRRLAIDDSRLVQTIASQNQNTPPLKAYVLYNDIQSTDKLNSRITQLARL